jgi:hypothetical protein
MRLGWAGGKGRKILLFLKKKKQKDFYFFCRAGKTGGEDLSRRRLISLRAAAKK